MVYGILQFFLIMPCVTAIHSRFCVIPFATLLPNKRHK